MRIPSVFISQSFINVIASSHPTTQRWDPLNNPTEYPVPFLSFYQNMGPEIRRVCYLFKVRIPPHFDWKFHEDTDDVC